MKDRSVFSQVFWALIAFFFGIPLAVMVIASALTYNGPIVLLAIPVAIGGVWWSRRVNRQKAEANR